MTYSSNELFVITNLYFNKFQCVKVSLILIKKFRYYDFRCFDFGILIFGILIFGILIGFRISYMKLIMQGLSQNPFSWHKFSNKIILWTKGNSTLMKKIFGLPI